jgi:hypothetical protein
VGVDPGRRLHQETNMSALTFDADIDLLNLVSFKWLMAGRGWSVNLSRLQQDPGYVRSCAQRGLDSGHDLLHARSAELLAALGHDARQG